MTQKEDLWEAYFEGYDLGYHVEELDENDYKTARANFEQWYSINFK